MGLPIAKKKTGKSKNFFSEMQKKADPKNFFKSACNFLYLRLSLYAYRCRFRHL